MDCLTDEEEKIMDKRKDSNGQVFYETKDGHIINNNDIILYGDINFDNKEDVELIKRFNLINEDESGNWIYSNFNYDKGNFIQIDYINKGYSTWNALLWFKFKHCLIGKPNKIIVYKDSRNKLR